MPSQPQNEGMQQTKPAFLLDCAGFAADPRCWTDMRCLRGLRLALLGFLLFLGAVPVSANAGVPMIAVYLPPAWLSLVPIILLEAAVGARTCALPLRRTAVASLAANAASSLVGIPVVWTVLAAMELAFAGTAMGLQSTGQKLYAVTVQAPWLIPYEDHLSWMIPAAVIALTTVFFLMSVLVEHVIVRLFFPETPSRDTFRWVIKANALSYLVLLVVASVLLAYQESLAAAFELFRPITEFLVHLAFRLAGAVLGE